MNQTRQHEPNNAASTSRRYRLALTTAMLLFLVMLTISITVIIISRDDDEREAEFETTLTAVYAQVQQTNAAPLTRTPQNVPPPVHQEYAFVPATESPSYAAADSCSVQTISGTIRDQDGTLTDAYNIYLWGDFLPAQHILTGELAGQDAGHWSVTLESALNRRVFVQLTAADRYLSAPVELNFDVQDCERNHATIAFEQIAPLD